MGQGRAALSATLSAPHVRQRSGSHSRPFMKQGHEIVLHPPSRQRHPGKRLRQVGPHAQNFSQNPPDFAQGQFAGVHGPSWSQQMYSRTDGFRRRRSRCAAFRFLLAARPTSAGSSATTAGAVGGSSAPSHRARYCGRDVASREKNTLRARTQEQET